MRVQKARHREIPYLKNILCGFLRPTHEYRKDLWDAHLACYAARVAGPDLIQKPHRGLNLRPLPRPISEIFGDYDARKSVEYYLRFRETENPRVLIEFLEQYPFEFEYSGWVLSAFGYILLGYASIDKNEARQLFNDFWRRRSGRRQSILPTALIAALASVKLCRSSLY